MKALLMEEYKKLKYADFPDPKIEDPFDILVRVKAVAICGSDIHGFDGSTGRRQPPIVMGHEAAGEVVAVGSSVKKFKVGDRITFDSTIYCGRCAFCLSGQFNLCDNRMVIGVSCDDYRRHGAFAEYLVVPQQVCCHLPQDVSWEEAALTEPAAVAAHAVRITPQSLNENAAVVGCGLIGLLLLDIIKTAVSGKIIALDIEKSRREAAAARGSFAVFDPADAQTAKKIMEMTDGRGVDRVYEVVGASAPIQSAISITRKGGSVTLIGNVSPKIELPLQAVVSRQISLFGSCAVSGEFPIALDLIGRKKIDVKSLISKTVPLSEGEIWMNKLYEKQENLLKVVLIP